MSEITLSSGFQEAFNNKQISCRKHPSLDLWILNYTPEVQFSRLWNDVTMQCRGLIVDKDCNIVSRPFRKFFNLSEHDNPSFERIPIGNDFQVVEKMDGSLGISYMTPEGLAISTRGSFESDQAIKATEMLRTTYSHLLDRMSPETTYLFEIIYKQNRIVVDYHGQEKLVLLGAIDTKTGIEIDLEDLCHLYFDQPEVFDVSSISDLPRDTQNFEGYVVVFSMPGGKKLRVKVKLDEYLRMHRLMTGITEKRLWEMLRNNDDVDKIIKDLPDEMHQEVSKVVESLREKYQQLLSIHLEVLIKLNLHGLSRKEQALKIQSCGIHSDLRGMCNQGVLFAILDDKMIQAAEKVWKLIEPKSNDVICKADLTS